MKFLVDSHEQHKIIKNSRVRSSVSNIHKILDSVVQFVCERERG